MVEIAIEPNIQRCATVALSATHNGLSRVGLPGAVISASRAGISKVDAVLDEQRPWSASLDRPSREPDPGIPYTVIVSGTDVPDGPAPAGPWVRLLARPWPPRLASSVADLTLFGSPKDLAVSVSSGRRAHQGQTPLPQVQEISVGHLAYLSTVTGPADVADGLLPGAAA